jgi:hypothetical protein
LTQYTKTRELITHSDEEKELEKKLESITKSLRKQYFKNSLVTLSKKNIENARTICNYIIAEQTEINIKDSTKEGKIKILVWLSNHFQDHITENGIADKTDKNRGPFIIDILNK